ncbi:hypothetical protein CDD83_8118 [Cordyceps sp. RAO-2017]|nr:hypothetical protein CDD83_8118 [Cordyceps sp. RAO-2017]
MAAGEPSARAGRQALYAAVDRVCDEIDRELAAEKEKNKRLLQQLHQSSDDGQADPPPINRQPARECTKPGFKAPQPTASSGVSRPQANSASTPPNSSNLPCSTTSSGTLDMAALKAKHVDLQRRFNALAANFKTAKEAIRKRSGERDMLKRRTSYLENAIACAEAKHGITILGERGPSPPAAAPALSGSFLRQNVDDVVGVRPAACHEAKERNGPSPSTASTQEETDEGPEEQLPKLSRDDPADSSLVKQEPSSDTPLVVSERTLKKRKRGDSIPNEANSRLKSEPSGQSSPLLSLIRHVPNTQESSLDLGDIEQRMTTPRKRTVVGIFEPGNVSVASPDMQTPVVHRAVLCGASEQSSEAVGDSVLAPLSVNVRKSGIGEDKAKVRPPRRGLGFAISVLAEDGDAYGANASTFKRSGF